MSQEIPDYITDQSPRFLVDSDGLVREKNRLTHEKKFAASTGSLEASVLDGKGNDTGLKPTIESSTTDESKFYIAIPSGNILIPGVLTLKVILSQDEKRQELNQKFRWGVVTVNYKQSSFSPGDRAELGIAVVDDQGQLICNAKTNVAVTSPSKKTTIYSTQETCKDDGAKKRSDYKVIYIPEDEGQHTVKVTVETNDGIRERESGFLVTDEAAVTLVHDDTDSLIFPSSQKSVKLTIHTRRPLKSMAHYPLPKTFTIENINVGGKLESTDSGEMRIVWPLILKADETITLSFTYRAPEINPAIYQLGLFEIRHQDALIQSKIKDDLDTIFLDKHRYEIIAANYVVYEN